jgi:hypothetical protein
VWCLVLVYGTCLIRNIHKELTKPVDPELTDIEYLPTQFLTEFIKNQGYDSITFKSSLIEGTNTVLFNINGIEVIKTDISQIYEINYHFHRPYLNMTDKGTANWQQ